jgi:hypothetical protein
MIHSLGASQIAVGGAFGIQNECDPLASDSISKTAKRVLVKVIRRLQGRHDDRHRG